jgi:hypothetical protein
VRGKRQAISNNIRFTGAKLQNILHFFIHYLQLFCTFVPSYGMETANIEQAVRTGTPPHGAA